MASTTATLQQANSSPLHLPGDAEVLAVHRRSNTFLLCNKIAAVEGVGDGKLVLVTVRHLGGEGLAGSYLLGNDVKAARQILQAMSLVRK
jgi:hypothetical protein